VRVTWLRCSGCGAMRFAQVGKSKCKDCGERAAVEVKDYEPQED
jgi:rRNA maturation endonuclease Nob1